MQIRRDGLAIARKTKAIPRRISARRRLPAGDYVFPGERAYPIPDAHHAGLALQALLRTAGRHGTGHDARVRALKVLKAVKRRFPGIYEGEANLVADVKRRYRIQPGVLLEAAESLDEFRHKKSIVDRLADKYG